MQHAVLVVPGSLDRRTGGYIYNRRVVERLRERGWSIDVVELDTSFPRPTPDAHDAARRAFAAIPSGTIVIVDSLALGALPDVLEHEHTRLGIVALVHLPLSADLDSGRAAADFVEGERRALAAARLAIVTGRATLSLLERYDLPSGRVVVIEPGTDRMPRAPRSPDGTLTLLTVAALTPTKGYDILIQALSSLKQLDWRLLCAGSVTRHRETVQRVRTLVDLHGLEARVSLLGELDDSALHQRYQEADVFVSASRQETYGMALADALAQGLPVVATSTGASREFVGDTAGLLVPPGDPDALAQALERVISDRELRERFTRGAELVATGLRTWQDAAGEWAAVLQGVSI
jgi:glycosyltransferase involved in cell wall biosynthesis